MSSLLTVAIQGEPASFHEIAAYRYYPEPIKLLYCDSFDRTFQALLTGRADRAFVAVRNSDHGEIHEVSRLMRRTRTVVEGEYNLPITQHLIGLPSAAVQNITRVVSHPIALSQCSSYLRRQLSQAELVPYHDTSAAVEYVQQLGDATVAAVGSEAAARLFGLEIIQSSIQNDVNNATLFRSLALHQ